MPPSPFVPAARAAAAKYGIPEPIFLRQVNQESGWNPHARSSAGAMGLLQLMPGTARGLGVSNPFDPVQNLDGGARYLRDQFDRFGNWRDALAAYNAGPGNVVSGAWEHIPETTRYVNDILSGLNVAAPAAGTPSRVTPSRVTPQQPQMTQADTNLLLSIINGEAPSALQLASVLGEQNQNPLEPRSTPVTQPPAGGKFKLGVPVLGLTSIGGLHQTENLPGYPAHDYFAPSGSSVVAPVTGKVIKLSGHDPAEGPVEGPHGPLGWSVYIEAPNGHIYYLTHMGSRSVRLGQTIRAGTPIGTVADYAKYGTPSHIHMGVH